MRLTFDRGTLLLDAPEGDAVFAETGALKWDSRVGAWRAPACTYAEVTSGLSGRDVRFSDDVRHSSGTPPDVSAPELRPYQQAALAAWESAACRGVIALPTGSGKTRVAMAGIAASRARTLVLVPTRVLLDQWERELSQVVKTAIGRLGDGEARIESITVATYESAFRHMAEIGNRFELLVVDETHHFGNGLRDETLEMCVAPMRMGLTATPSKGEAWEKVASLVGPVVYQLTIGDLVGTWLAGLDMSTIRLDLERDERIAYERSMREFQSVAGPLRDALGATAPWKELVKLASRSPAGRRALAAFRDAQRLVWLTSRKRKVIGELLERHRDNKVLIFTADNASAYEIARERLVMPITCDIGRSEREAVLAKFRSGELRALVSSRVLNEGIDVPDADVAIIVGAALGEREYVQRIGRLLRPAPGKRAHVYELLTPGTMEERRAKRRRDGGATGHVAASPA